MMCPNCKSKNTIVYSIQIPYEHVYKVKKNGTLYKKFSKRCLGDSQYDCYYCTNCLKEFDYIIDNKGVVELKL